MDQEIEIDVERHGGATVVVARGEVDVATAPALRVAVDEALDRAPDDVVVDLRGVTFIDSTGLGVLIGARRRSLDAGGRFRVLVTEPRILKVFEITGLADLFTIDPSLEPAAGA